jgi:hypothetical protein
MAVQDESSQQKRSSEAERLHKKITSFPIRNMPSFIRNFAEDIAEVYGVPIEFPAMSIISAYGTALGNKVRLRTDKYINYPQLWVVIVAPSGVGKSEPLKIAYSPIRDFEKKEYLRFQESLGEWKSACVEAKQNGAQPPEKPKQKRILCNDTTPEALFSLLDENKTLTICRDELAGHFQDFGRYNKSGEVAHHISCFDNVDFSVDRKSEDNALMIFKPVLSMIGTIQPAVLQDVANKNFMRENGYLQRCLFIYPGNVERPNVAKFAESINVKKQSVFEALKKSKARIEIPLNDTHSLLGVALKNIQKGIDELQTSIPCPDDLTPDFSKNLTTTDNF